MVNRGLGLVESLLGETVGGASCLVNLDSLVRVEASSGRRREKRTGYLHAREPRIDVHCEVRRQRAKLDE